MVGQSDSNAPLIGLGLAAVGACLSTQGCDTCQVREGVLRHDRSACAPVFSDACLLALLLLDGCLTATDRGKLGLRTLCDDGDGVGGRS